MGLTPKGTGTDWAGDFGREAGHTGDWAVDRQAGSAPLHSGCAAEICSGGPS